MESYKINCGKNLLRGYHTIKSAEETSIHKDDFVHIALTKLKDYDKPVVVKVYDADNIHLHIELNILKQVIGFRNTPRLICEFSCNDDKNKYITKLKKQISFCGNGLNKLHFFVYEYIAHFPCRHRVPPRDYFFQPEYNKFDKRPFYLLFGI